MLHESYHYFVLHVRAMGNLVQTLHGMHKACSHICECVIGVSDREENNETQTIDIIRACNCSKTAMS